MELHHAQVWHPVGRPSPVLSVFRPVFKDASGTLDKSASFSPLFRQDSNKLSDEDLFKLLADFKKWALDFTWTFLMLVLKLDTWIVQLVWGPVAKMALVLFPSADQRRWPSFRCCMATWMWPSKALRLMYQVSHPSMKHTCRMCDTSAFPHFSFHSNLCEPLISWVPL